MYDQMELVVEAYLHIVVVKEEVNVVDTNLKTIVLMRKAGSYSTSEYAILSVCKSL